MTAPPSSARWTERSIPAPCSRSTTQRACSSAAGMSLPGARHSRCHRIPPQERVMATHLHRLGRWSHDHRRTVLIAWLVALVGVIACAAAFKGQVDNKFEVPGTESQQAQKLLEHKYPEASGAF